MIYVFLHDISYKLIQRWVVKWIGMYIVQYIYICAYRNMKIFSTILYTYIYMYIYIYTSPAGKWLSQEPPTLLFPLLQEVKSETPLCAFSYCHGYVDIYKSDTSGHRCSVFLSKWQWKIPHRVSCRPWHAAMFVSYRKSTREFGFGNHSATSPTTQDHT